MLLRSLGECLPKGSTCRDQNERLSREQAAILVSGLAGSCKLPEDQTHTLLLLSTMQPAREPGARFHVNGEIRMSWPYA